MTAAELDAQVLTEVTSRPGSTVWDLCQQFPQVPAPAGAGLPPPPPGRTVPSVTPAQVCAALARLRRAGRVRRTTDPGPGGGGGERWAAQDY